MVGRNSEVRFVLQDRCRKVYRRDLINLARGGYGVQPLRLGSQRFIQRDADFAMFVEFARYQQSSQITDRDWFSLVRDKGAPFAIIIHDHAQVLLTSDNGRSHTSHVGILRIAEISLSRWQRFMRQLTGKSREE